MTRTIGKYQIQGEIGRGGFGTVYRAWDPTVNRAVAIKVLTVQGDEDLLTRFRNEAAAAGNLHHKNIVTVHDFGEHEGVPYMVMQLLEGNTLQEVMSKQHPLSLIQKIDIMSQVAEGLHHAHLHGIVHRDVKPPNIMILPGGNVQIMDFGIARLAASTSRQTRTGFVIGTVLYMAPEQFLPNKVVDHRADIWAYGVIYYEFLTGSHPFAAAEETSVLYQVAHVEPPPLHSVLPDCPSGLDEAIHRLLAKDPDLRYSSLRDLLFDVQPVLMELKRERGGELLATARHLLGEDRLEEAQAAAQEIIELDPGNREAHSLLQQARQRLQRRLIQPRINSLLQKAEQEVQARELQGAIDSLESALRLSQTDPAIEVRLNQVRALLEQSRRAERLLADAQRELRAHNYTEAFRIASEAAQADPGNTSAAHLISQIQRELDMREAQRLLEDGRNKVRGLLLLQQYEDALRELNELAARFPDDEGLSELFSVARREKMHQERLEQRRKEISLARDLLRKQRFDDAIGSLEMLLVDFPGDPEINQLLGFARDEWNSARRAQMLAGIRVEADRLCNEHRFDEALSLLEAALSEHPGEPALVRLIHSVSEARQEHETRLRTEAVRSVLTRAGECERKGDPEAALRLVEQGLDEYPDAEALTAVAKRLRQVVEAKAAAARQAAELEMARNRVRQEVEAGNYDRALELVLVALKRYPRDSALATLERSARYAIARRAEAEERARIEAERRAREEAERKAREEAEKRAAEERARLEAEHQKREAAERKAREEAERRAAEERERREAERKAHEEAERKARAEAERREAEERIRLEAERKAKEEAEQRAAEERARREAERKEREEAERLAREEAERREAEERIRLEAERKAREEAERRVAEEQARLEAERKAREAAEQRAAEHRAHLEAERKAREEAERQARKEAERRAAEEQARLEAERKAREEAEQQAAEERARVEALREARAEAERRAAEERARVEALRKAREQAERQAREQAQRRAAEEQARLEAEQKAREEAELRAAQEREQAEAERKAREEAERRALQQRARLEQERKAREEAERNAAEQRARLEKERKAREEAEQRAAAERELIEKERRAREEAERRAKQEAERAEREAREERERRQREERTRRAAAAAAGASGAAAAAAPAPEPPKRNSMPLMLGGAGIVILALAGGVVFFRSANETARTPVAREAPAQTTLAPTPATETTTEPVNPAVDRTEPPPSRVNEPAPAKATPAAKQQAQAQQPPQPQTKREEPRPASPEISFAKSEPAAQTGNTIGASNTGRIVSATGPGVQTSQTTAAPVTVPATSMPPPRIEPAPPEKAGTWLGKRNGKLVWSGELAPGAKVTINRQRVTDGPGELTNIDQLPAFTQVEVTGVNPADRISVTPTGANSLVIANTSSAPIRFIEVNWRVRQ